MKRILLIGALCFLFFSPNKVLAVDPSVLPDSMVVSQQQKDEALGVTKPDDIVSSLKEDGYLSMVDGGIYNKIVSSKSLLPISGIIVSTFGVPEFEVMYCGRPYRVSQSDLNHVADADRMRLGSMSDVERLAFVEHARKRSVDLRVWDFFDGMELMQKLRGKGLAIPFRRIYDTSEHTDGTGFEIEVLNTSNKTIKYISFTVIGYNSVNDPVRGRLGKSLYITVRGVGPIKSGERASYDWEYLWFTDLVETHKITQINVQYMDGTARLFNQINNLYLSDREKYLYDILLDPDTINIMDEYMAKNKK